MGCLKAEVGAQHGWTLAQSQCECMVRLSCRQWLERQVDFRTRCASSVKFREAFARSQAGSLWVAMESSRPLDACIRWQ